MGFKSIVTVLCVYISEGTTRGFSSELTIGHCTVRHSHYSPGFYSATAPRQISCLLLPKRVKYILPIFRFRYRLWEPF